MMVIILFIAIIVAAYLIASLGKDTGTDEVNIPDWCDGDE